MTKKELITRLSNLRKADRDVAAMPKGHFRSVLQSIIGEELERLSMIQVESAESPNEELVPRQKTFCAVDAKVPSKLKIPGQVDLAKAGPLFFL